ncbi:hypothetical protein ASD04_06985 [Devosia sp. Root436]|uniref:hypothetical protein n=1 Tax=Devosia sp. Root436 TaxID=1736537 RepID=UPI0006F8E2D0|nr:hypothetical protein [Devosia sp. Root436]KQX40367.1 hypothetical protein ASD04_06985 [Devosia sp. Root436]
MTDTPDTREPYLPGLCGLQWRPDAAGGYVADTDDDFVRIFFDWKRALTEIGYVLTKANGKWIAGFRPGMADKTAILATLLRIREHQLEKLGVRP